MKCKRCGKAACLALPSHHTSLCAPCFLEFFQRQIKRAIKEQRLFSKEERILVAVSGGKDSLALLWQLNALGYQVQALHIDLGIPEYSARLKAVVQDSCDRLGIPVQVLSTARHGLSIPELAKRLRQQVCSFCGKIKRHFFNLYALENGFDVLATGHNLDDEVSRLLANILDWKLDYLARQGPFLPQRDTLVRKVKPLYRVTEFETAAFCFLKGIRHNLVPCPYSKGASYTFYKRLLEELEAEQPGRKLSFYRRFLDKGRDCFQAACSEEAPVLACQRCGAPTTLSVCSVCRLKDKLGPDL